MVFLDSLPFLLSNMAPDRGCAPRYPSTNMAPDRGVLQEEMDIGTQAHSCYVSGREGNPQKRRTPKGGVFFVCRLP